MKKRIILLGAVMAAGVAVTNAQTREELALIVEKTNVSELGRMAKESEIRFKSEKREALLFAKKNNIPVIIENKDGSMSELMKIVNGNPIYYTNSNTAAAKSTRANHLHQGGSLGLSLAGENMTANVWDGGGVNIGHQEFGGRVTIGDNATQNSNTMNNRHATHVSGTIGAAGVKATAKGMAPRVTIKTYDWNNDLSEISTAASQGLLISNHSYGYRPDLVEDWNFGAYITESAKVDEILFNAPYYVICKAAGNSGSSGYNASALGGSSTAFDNLSDTATSKNAVVVANAQDASIDSNGKLTSVSINSSSSQGPTDDLRIKPDITGNGTSVYSCTASSQIAYESMTGTSMASPNVTGTLILVNQHFKNVTGSYMLGAALKGLALHTADDAGAAGPDVNFGWGLLNAKTMAETINNRNTIALISDKSLAGGAKETVYINSDGVTPIKASISWYDRAGAIQTSASHLNSTTKRLVNDLDLRIVSSSNASTYYPWTLTSRSANAKQDNNSDNFERVDAGVLPAGQYAVTITHKGTLTGGSQNYTLIVTGKANPVAAVLKSSEIKNSLIEATAANLMSVYPNPAKNEINVRLKAKGDQSLMLNVFDASGKQVLTQKAAEGVNKIDISRIPAGAYILSVDGGKEKLTHKFIKQ
ncbi:S8 family serine peptidase [Chryseobacterium herbae]|uniref:S8 family serine peptidase n=1 Tax=Chryseobacterium herbae TaxID=2976476 RepID=A0ABT2IS54_9FLAO|nr:S8 family serine peptidase [Chryseobacterium sp. pc1-10]MCT2561661.1 S8 family serine peptidase [Chryseobacterium sp. pc1-10]